MRLTPVILLLAAALAPAALADWLQPDPSYRDAQFLLRAALRDTVGQPGNAARLDTLGVALLRLCRLGDAEAVFRRVLALDPRDQAARAGLGKLALFRDRAAEAESLLAGPAQDDPAALADLFAAKLRRGDWAGAARLAEPASQPGRAELLDLMATEGSWEFAGLPAETRVRWSRAYPVPLVKVQLNGQGVLMALDTGAGDLLLDAAAARRCGVRVLDSQAIAFWSGQRMAVRNAMVQRLEIGGIRARKIPAGVLSLRRWSLEVNPQGEAVAGIIGLNFLRRFTPTLDYHSLRLELRAPGIACSPAPGARRVPFELWGENELTVYGSLSGGRRMAMLVQTGVPGCGVGAPSEVFDEVGVKRGAVSRLVKSAGSWLQGRSWTAVVVPTVAVGPVVRDKVPGWSDALDSSELWRHGVRRDALLSHDFFRGCRVTIDWGAHELIVEE
jgi:hypothetical protein